MMHTKQLLQIGFLLVFCIANAQKKPVKYAGEQKIVNTVFENYRQALTDSKGTEAVKFVDSQTIAYFSNILDYVKSTDSTQLATKSVYERLLTLVVRQQASKEAIASFNGETLMAYCISSGLVGKAPIAGSTITNIQVKNHTAKAELVVFSKPQNFFLSFFKENDWKINLAAIYSDADKKLHMMAEEQHKTETQLLLAVIAKNFKRPVRPDIWKPIN